MTTSADDVLAIMHGNLTESEISPFLTTAKLLVSNYLSSASLSTTTTEEIEKYLAAHLASVKKPYAIRSKLDISEDTYGYQGGKGLNATPYGEIVLMLDTSGILASKMGAATIEIEVVDIALDDDD